MLKVFRENIKYLSWILWVVIGLFVLFVFVDFGGGLAKNQGGAADAVAATVGSREVKIEDVRRELQQLDNLYRQLYGEQFTQEMAQQMRLPQQALERAVTQQILLSEAERLGLEVSDAEVRDRVLEESVFKKPDGKFVGQEEYVRILSQAGYTPTSFEASMRQDLLRQKLQDALRAGIWVSDAEVEKSYREQVEKAKIRYLQLSRARFPEAAEVPPADLQAYFQAHQEEFKLPEQREGAYVLVETDALRSTVQVPDALALPWFSVAPLGSPAMVTDSVSEPSTSSSVASTGSASVGVAALPWATETSTVWPMIAGVSATARTVTGRLPADVAVEPFESVAVALTFRLIVPEKLVGGVRRRPDSVQPDRKSVV